MNKTKVKNRLIKATFIALFLLPLLSVIEVSVISSQQAYAQAKTKKVQSIRQKHIKAFEKIQEAFEEENNREITRQLDKLSKETDLNNIEKAYIHNFRGNIYFQQDNLNAALREFKGIEQNSEGVPDAFLNQMLYVIAQVLFSQEKHREALGYAQRWFKTLPVPTADGYLLIGQAQYQLKEYDNALRNVQSGIDKYSADGRKPKESWLNLLNNIYRSKGQYAKMVPVLKRIIKYYPKKAYLSSLAGVYNELSDQLSMTAIFQSMYDQGLLTTESEIVTIASLQLNFENPFKAAQIMEKGLNEGSIPKSVKNYGLYSQALFFAKEYEKALAPLSQAAKLESNGKYYDQLGQSYISLNRYSEAESALTSALNKGGLQNTGQTQISLGLSQFEQKKFQTAKASFSKALKYQKVRSSAQNWIKYVSLIKRLNMSTDVLKSMVKASFVSIALVAMISSTASADEIDDLVSKGKSRISSGAASQKRIDDISEQTEKVLAEAHKELKSAEVLKLFNDRLRRTVTAQEGAKQELVQSIEDASLIERQIVPLMFRMIDGLEKFVGLDLPFKQDERMQRIERIRSYLTNANITAAERFRQVLAAYTAESDYGKSIDVYTDQLALSSGNLTVNVLQVGRTGLYYQTLDGNQSGYWDKSSKSWIDLDSSHNDGITTAIRITQGKESKDLMRLPIADAFANRCSGGNLK